MSDGIPCPLCGNGKLIAPPLVAALEDVATNYYVIPRAQYEALMAELNRIQVFCANRAKRFPTSETVCGRIAADIAVALRAAGIQREE